MWYKVSWLTFWVSMTLWVGNFWGCAAPGEDQNYRAHADGGGLYERENYDRPRDPEEKGILAGIRDSIDAAPANNNRSPQSTSATNRGNGNECGEGDVDSDVDSDADAGTPGAVAEADISENDTNSDADAGLETDGEYAGDGLPEETEPSITSLDRSHWKKITARADEGITKHNPIYHKDCPTDRKRMQIDFSQPVEDQLIASLDGAESKQWDGVHTADVFIQVGKHCFDTVALPVRVVMQHPWTVVTTP